MTSLSFLYLLRSCFPVLNGQSLNLVECPEFRQLLMLLRPGPERLIPHRMKMHELLLQAWRNYFGELHLDLTACFPHLPS